ncbi:MAG: GntR family transcriptional regulator [Arenicellales bacterium]|jgi:DNA-binding GntR family transcriptional regulator|nr:GntR family transcriptional regulator [Arenicellales bacterium]
MNATVTSLVQARRSLTVLAYERLEELIVTLHLKPGSVQSEAALVQETGFGRTPVREALQRLEKEGLVEILPRKGVMITEIDIKRQFLLLELSRVLLTLLARTGARRATPEQRQQFGEIALDYDEIVQNEDLMTFMRVDSTLNKLLCDASHNEHTCRAMNLLLGLNRRVGYVHLKNHGDVPTWARIRAEFARAIEQGNADAAVEITGRRLDYIESSIKSAVHSGEI